MRWLIWIIYIEQIIQKIKVQTHLIQIKKVSNALKSEKLEKAKKLEDETADYDIN